MSGCHFHLCQSVIRKGATVGLKTTYGDTYTSDFTQHVRILMALAFVPLDEVHEAFDVVCQTMPEIGRVITKYFDETYVNGPVIRGTGDNVVRRAPLFPPTLWNVTDRFENDFPTTNNYTEAWHRRKFKYKLKK